LGIFLGGLGVHRFYLGYNGIGLIQLLLALLSCGFGLIVTCVWGLVEGILILAGKIDRDANGQPLTS
jgi:TM2 domain-containing membrane protein YozV